MACESCGDKPKKCNKDFTKAVIEIDNPGQTTLMRKVTIPASMGDDTTVPPVAGKYHNVLLYYEANHKSYLYSSDGIPTLLANGLTDYEEAVNLPQINGHTLSGNKTGDQLGLQDKLTAGDNITIENDVISATDTTYGPATDAEIGLVKPGDGLEVDANGTMSAKAGTNITVDENGISEAPYEDYLPIEIHETRYIDDATGTNTYVHYSIIDKEYAPVMVMADPDDPNAGKTASEFDFEYKPTLMTNMSPWDTADPHVTYGPLIIDHEIKIQNNLGSGTEWNRPIVGIDDDGVMHNIDGSTQASEVNMKYASRAWTTLYNDGTINPNIDTLTAKNPRTWIAQDYEGNYFIGVCGGRQAEDTGMQAIDEVNFVMDFLGFDARVIWNYDGGGSSNFLYHGIRQNRLVEREDRACPTWLVWSSKTAKHDGLFRNQSINNEANIEAEIAEDGHIITNDSIISGGMVGDARVTSNAGSRIMKVSPRVVVYNLNFNITGEGNLPSYSDLYVNLPRTDANYYFLALKHSDYSTVPVYITSMADSSLARIRTIQALEPGTYSIHFVVQCGTQY